jgi:predicted PurR-regulated permease PerM
MTPLRLITAALCIGVALIVWPLWPPLLLAAWTADLLRPLLVRFERGLKGRRNAAAMLSMLLMLAVVVPLGLVTTAIVISAQELITSVQQSPSAVAALETLMSTPSNTTHVPSTLPEALALARQSGTQGLGLLTQMAGAFAALLVGLFVYFGGTYAILLHGAAVGAWVGRHSPLAPEHLERLARAFRETGRGLLVGVGLTSLTQGALATLIYLSLGVPRAWVLGPLTGLVSVVPLVGTGLVWVPVALGLFLTGRPGRAVILLVLGVFVIGLIDNLLRPLFARLGALQLPLFILFLSVFGGLAAFGAWGALLGPLVVRLTLEALELREPAASK